MNISKDWHNTTSPFISPPLLHRAVRRSRWILSGKYASYPKGKITTESWRKISAPQKRKEKDVLYDDKKSVLWNLF